MQDDILVFGKITVNKVGHLKLQPTGPIVFVELYHCPERKRIQRIVDHMNHAMSFKYYN